MDGFWIAMAIYVAGHVVGGAVLLWEIARKEDAIAERVRQSCEYWRSLAPTPEPRS